MKKVLTLCALLFGVFAGSYAQQIKKNTQNQDGQAGLDGTISKTELFPPEIPSLEDVTVPVDVNALIEELEQKTNQNNN